MFNLLFDKIIDIEARNPIPNINIVNKIELAILTAARACIPYLATTNTSVVPINVWPKFPINIGTERIKSSRK